MAHLNVSKGTYLSKRRFPKEMLWIIDLLGFYSIEIVQYDHVRPQGFWRARAEYVRRESLSENRVYVEAVFANSDLRKEVAEGVALEA